ncbi:MAG: HD domain-containing phosphohydrolase [Rubrivivax sp.]
MNSPAAASTPFTRANPHALATILDCAQTKSIIASRDIFDIAGFKLWARDQPVSVELQRKLMDRQLRNPLETCLMAEDGVTAKTLQDSLWALLSGTSPLSALLRGAAPRLLQEVHHLPMHSVAQLLLTAAQTSRPASFEHAVQAMAVAGALMIGHGGGPADIRVAMLGGLLHDLGEMYIDPRYGEADADRTLDLLSYQQLVVHPHVGRLLLQQLTNYPPSLARAVAEHHERLDGSGYPHALQRDDLSNLGKLLAVTEATLGALRGDAPCLARASVALRVVPGEFDLGWVGRISAASRAEPALAARADAARVQQRLMRLEGVLAAAQAGVAEVAAVATAPKLKAAMELATHLLQRLRTGWNASGLWSPEALADGDAGELDAIEHELSFRLRGVERAARLRAGALTGEEALRLENLCAGLRTLAD